MSAIFWIEKVEREDGQGHFLQLQYTQKVILNFFGIECPHIAVARRFKHCAWGPATRGGAGPPDRACHGGFRLARTLTGDVTWGP
jgi:hypothetical protein